MRILQQIFLKTWLDLQYKMFWFYKKLVTLQIRRSLFPSFSLWRNTCFSASVKRNVIEMVFNSFCLEFCFPKRRKDRKRRSTDGDHNLLFIINVFDLNLIMTWKSVLTMTVFKRRNLIFAENPECLSQI